MAKCTKPVGGTEILCGQEFGLFCSDECETAANQAELAEIGITPEMMKEALEGYFECNEIIKRREKEGSRTFIQPDEPPQIPYESGPE
jgi:hypothetical protein